MHGTRPDRAIARSWTLFSESGERHHVTSQVPSGALTFQPGAGPSELVERTTGARWSVEEERLLEPATGRVQPRLGGRVVYWFGWYAFYPDAEVYRP